MQKIAHAVQNLDEAQKAIDYGCDLLEIDISQNMFTGNFLIQHDAIKGKFGIGKNLLEILNSQFKEKLVLDLKAVKYSPDFGRKFANLVGSAKIKNLILTSIDLKASSKIAQETNAEIYYGFINNKSINYFWKISSLLYKPAGFSVKSSLIDKDLIRRLKSTHPKSQIWAWTVNDGDEIKRLEKIGIDAVITDNWRS